MSFENHPKVVILLATYNGQNYLEEQLTSFAAQTYPYWSLFSSDDGSSDETVEILKKYQRKWNNSHEMILLGPQKGFVRNFLSLVCASNINAEFYAFADQDDVWEPEKLRNAISFLRNIPAEVPALYCSRTKIVDENNNQIGLSPLFLKRPSFANALVQNIGGGNTMVFNNAARELLKAAGQDTVAVSHDWWAYMLVSGCGGQVFYDSIPEVRYRQHGNNQVGHNITLRAKFKRLRMIIHGRFKLWNSRNTEALYREFAMLTPENKEILTNFYKSRKGNLFLRLWFFWKSGVYRQTFFDNVGLIAAVIFNKI